MVAWPTRVAVSAGLFDEVIISTDDPEIAEVAIQYGAKQPFVRPQQLADEFTGTAAVLKHALETMLEQDRILPEFACCLYGTSVMVTSDMLKKAFDLLSGSRCEMVMAVAEYSHPIERALQFDDNGTLTYRQPEFVQARTQDITPSYHDIGLFYAFSVKAFMGYGGTSFVPLKKKGIIVPRSSAIDIDTEEDWIIAEILGNIFLKF